MCGSISVEIGDGDVFVWLLMYSRIHTRRPFEDIAGDLERASKYTLLLFPPFLTPNIQCSFLDPSTQRLCALSFWFLFPTQRRSAKQQGGATISFHAAAHQQRRGRRAQASCQEARGNRGGPPSSE